MPPCFTLDIEKVTLAQGKVEVSFLEELRSHRAAFVQNCRSVGDLLSLLCRKVRRFASSSRGFRAGRPGNGAWPPSAQMSSP